MTKRTAIAPLMLALLVGALVAPSASSAASASSACTAGRTSVGGKAAQRFCGPATATATVGGKKFVFSGGLCAKAGSYFTVNIGTLVIHKLANAKPGNVPYFGIAVTPAGTGVHLTQALSWISGGKRYEVLANKITLDKGLKSGSFRGKAIPGGKVAGTFTC